MDFIKSFLPTVEHFGLAGYWFILLVAFVESLAFVGLVVPGTIIIVAMGFFALNGFYDIGDLIWFAAIGAILGDALSFHLGRKGIRLFSKNKFIFRQSYLNMGEKFFKRHGGKSILFGRFIGVFRPIIPFVAGMFKMEAGIFFLWSLISSILWATFFLLLGYLFGHAWQVMEIWSPRIGLFIVILVLVIAGVYAFDRFVITQGKKLLRFFGSISRSLYHAFITNPDILRIAEKHPSISRFLSHRTARGKFTGITLTLIAIAFIYIFSFCTSSKIYT